MSIRKLMVYGYNRLAFLVRFLLGFLGSLSNPQAFITVTNFLF